MSEPSPGDSTTSDTSKPNDRTVDIDRDDVYDRVRSALRAGAPDVVIGNYRLKREIASGGMGVVYEAVQENPRRVVALKVMRTTGMQSRNWVRRFEAEAQALARLHHPCIAQIFEAGTYATASGSVPFFAMEYIAGAKPLPEYAIRAGLDLRQRLGLFVGVCRAVHHAHTRGIIHRDLKPGNILVSAEGQAKVIDFGVARAADAEQAPADLQTDMRSLLGTLIYMSPEQCEGDPNAIDARSDVYTLGVVLYELMTGRLPYEQTRGMVEIARRICHEPPVRPSSVMPELAGDVEAMLLKALEKEPSRRYQSAGELADDLERLSRGEGVGIVRTAAVDRTAARPATGGVAGGVERQAFAWLLASLAGCALMYFVGNPLVYRWTGLDRWYMRTLVTALPGPSADRPLEAVTIVTLSDQTDFSALLAIPGAEGVSRTQVVSYRKLHGLLLRKLAESGVRAVAFDIAFGPPSEFDKDFVAGIQSSGVPVIVGQKAWESPSVQRKGLISPNIAPHVRRGGMTGQFTDQEPWYLDLVVQKLGAEPTPSLSLVTAAAFRHPDMELSLTVREVAESVELRYSKPDPATGTREWSRMHRVMLSKVRKEAVSSPLTSIDANDLVGRYLVRVPGDMALAQSTVDYLEVMKADQQQSRKWFDGKVALVCNIQAGQDVAPSYPDGRVLFGCHAHAAAIDAIIGGRSVRLGPDYLLAFAFTTVGALLSAATYRASRSKRLVVLAAGLVVAVLVGVALYVRTDYVVQPILAGLALVLGFVLQSLFGLRRVA